MRPKYSWASPYSSATDSDMAVVDESIKPFVNFDPIKCIVIVHRRSCFQQLSEPPTIAVRQLRAQCRRRWRRL